MDERIPIPIRGLLQSYLALLDSELPNLVTGLYLHGSIALGAFNEDLSDIDFVAFLNRRATAAETNQIRSLHQTLTVLYPRWLLEGSYLQWRDLGLLEESVSPGPIYHDGKLVTNEKFDVNSVTWWILKHHGVALVGPQPSQLALEVDWELLMARMKQNLNTYWASYTYKPARIAWLLRDYGVQWTVLGALRQYYTFVAHDITSKSGAGHYALDHLPARWHRIINEALHLRHGNSRSLYKSKLSRAGETYNFLRFLIRYCNTLTL